MRRILQVSAWILAATVAVVILAITPSQAQTPLLGNDFSGNLYDVNVITGAAINPRPTGINSLTGITYGSNGTLYGLTTFVSSPANTLVSINPVTGTATTIGATGLSQIAEGDLDFDPTTGMLFGAFDSPNAPVGPSRLFSINPANGIATIIGNFDEFNDFSAMAFSASGTLYVLNTNTDRLLTVNKSTAATTTSVNLSVALGTTAGMDFDPATGTLYVADGRVGGTEKLYTLNTTTGLLTLVGNTGVASGLAGLAFFVPEPSTLLLLGIGAISLLGRRKEKSPG